MWFAFACGLGLGAGHVLVGPDHLAAIAPIAGRAARRGARIGARWGLGHAGGVALVALAARFVLERGVLDELSSWSERAVGVALIALGLWGFYRSMQGSLAEHAHVARARAAFGFGALHGLAGSSHLLGVLPALAQPSDAAALAYLAGFTAGVIAAMTAFAAALAWSVERSGPRWRRALAHVASAAALVVGAWWLAQA